MESNCGAALGAAHTVAFNLRRKKAARFAALILRTRNAFLSGMSSPFNSSSGNPRRSSRCKAKCASHFRRSLLKNHMNFSKSGLPVRFFYYQDHKWVDYPADIIELIREHFEMKNAAINVDFHGSHLLLDALYMIQMDFQTGLCKFIAWVDEGGCSFFPESFLTGSDLPKSSQPRFINVPTFNAPMQNETQEMKVQLEIEFLGTNGCKLEERVEESNVQSKRIQIEQKPVSPEVDVKIDEDGNCNAKMPKVSDETPEANEYEMGNVQPFYDFADSDSVRNMFFTGMSPFISVDVLGIERCSSHLIQTRLELFCKQVEIMKRKRGDPNVQYAWLAATKANFSSIMKYGIGQDGPMFVPSFGFGLHLTSVNCAHLSAIYCDRDENGVRHMVLCRVILGNVEGVNPGSDQCHPSTEIFDSGVDDLLNPCRYIVWSMNKNTHIFPEYVVNFKMTSTTGGVLSGRKYEIGTRAVTNDQELQCELSLGYSPVAPAKPVGQLKAPKSAWLPFPMLFEAIANKVGAKDMKVVNMHYELFRHKRICREEFIQKLRLIAGDTLLRSALTSIHCKLPKGSV